MIDGKPLAFERFQKHWGFERTSNLISDRAVLQRGTQTTPPRSGLVQQTGALEAEPLRASAPMTLNVSAHNAYVPAGDIPLGSLSQAEPSAKELTRRAKMATDAT